MRAGWSRQQIAGFLLVSESQHIHGRLAWNMTVGRRIAGVTERDQQFPQIQAVGERATDIRVGSQRHEVSIYGLACPSRSIGRLGRQKGLAALDAANGIPGDDYLWHRGAGVSPSVPQLFSQSLTS